MTTPNQVAPDGAYVIGGATTNGDNYKYGQSLTDHGAAELMLGSFTAITNPFALLDMIGDILRTLPLEVLQQFESMIPDVVLGAFETVAGAVEAILDFFTTLTPVLASEFANWVDLILPDFIQEPFEQLVLLLAELLGPIPIVGDFVEQIADRFAQLRDNTDEAQTSANTANVQVAAIIAQLNAEDVGAGGVKIIEDFNEASASALPSDKWDTTHIGSGTGTFGPNGSGRAISHTSGAEDRLSFNRHKTALGTNYQSAKILIANKIGSDYTHVDPEHRILLRCNETKTDWVGCYLEFTPFDVWADMYYCIGGTVTHMTNQWEGDPAAGDVFEFRVGTSQSGDGPYTFELLRNDLTVLTNVDTGHVTAMNDTTHVYPALVVRPGVSSSGFFFIQSPAPELEAFVASDRVVPA